MVTFTNLIWPKSQLKIFNNAFEFYCLANNIKAEDNAEIARKKAVFVTILGQATFAKLRDLVNPNEIIDLFLVDIVGVLTAHYHPHTIKIAECYNIFKCMQEDGERVADFVANLNRLANICNFGQYLNIALHDQLVYGLRDCKCQRNLLSISDLTLDVALQKSTAAETADKGSKHVRADMTMTNLLARSFTRWQPRVSLAIAAADQAISQPIVSFKMLHVFHVRKWDIW